ncbi:MAG: 1-acylglycerol-3-phosphate O-acyltransferase [Deltaproteobacteria bacterium]|nr:1-acylglycerol-3-phosphate O-acyltransferase [Deltaproteobacteria bacterium]
MIRSIILVTIGVMITGVLSVIACIIGFMQNGENRTHLLARFWAKIMLYLSNTKVEVIGGDNVLTNDTQVFMANHQSNFDIFIVLAFVPGQFRWIAKKELFRIPIFGPAMRRCGYIEIDRQHHEKALKSLDEAAQKIREGKSVMTFPEGTRSKDGTVKAFKHGVFYLAIRSGVPITPITIVGSGDIMPKRSLRVNPGKVTMIIDKPIPVEGYKEETREALIEKVRTVIVKNYEEQRRKTKKETPLMLKKNLIVGFIMMVGFIFTTYPTPAAAAPNYQEGLWEIVTTMDIPGMPKAMQRPHKFTTCMTKQNAVPQQQQQKDQQCKITDQRIKGNTVEWTITCKDGTVSTGTITYSKSTFKGSYKTTTRQGGRKMVINANMTGKYLGPCKK